MIVHTHDTLFMGGGIHPPTREKIIQGFAKYYHIISALLRRVPT